MKSKLRPRCFFDIDIGHSPAGRIIFELYDDLCPKTTENFIKLCTGECGIGETTKKKLHYLNSIFHRVVKGFMIQGGDFSNFDGTGGESIYGGRFADENLETAHDKPFLLSMANCGPNTNGSQFFITTKPSSHLNGKHVVFGHVVSGENLIESIENLPVNASNKPVVDATISNCGELIPVRKKKSKKQKEKEASVDSSSSKGKKKKKSKKKKHRNKKKTKVVKEEESQEIYPKCSVRPDEIPEVPKPYFLYRGNLKDEPEKLATKENEANESSRYPTKDIIGRSGRVIKGRGQLRYYSKSPRDRLETPPHWRKESHKSMNNNNNISNNNNNSNNKSDETTNRFKRRKSPSADSNNKDRQRYRRSQRDRSNSRSGNTNARENYDEIAREKRKKYDVWKDLPTDDKSRRRKASNDLKDYADLQTIETKRRSASLENNNKSNDRDNNNSHRDNNYKASKSKQVVPPEKPDRSGAFEPGTIIFPYADESDDSQKPKKWDKMSEFKVVSESKSRTTSSGAPGVGGSGAGESRDKIDEWPGRNEHHDSTKKTVTATAAPATTDRQPVPSRKRSSSSGTGTANVSRKSKSPAEAIQRHTHSPPAHLIAKWQNRREKIMTRRSPVSRRSKDRTHSRPRHSPQPPPQARKHSSRYSQSPKCDLIPTDTKAPRDIAEKPRKLSGEVCKENKSSSGTMDSSPSSAGSSVVNDSTDTQQLEADKEKPPAVGADSRNSSAHVTSSSNNINNNNVVDKIKENVETKTAEDSAEKETLMVLKTADKPWLTSQWKTEEEEANKRNVKNNTTNSILAKLREDDQMKKSQEKQEKQTNASTDRKIPSPVSQSISKYRSPSGTKSSDDNVRSSYSSTSSSRSHSRRRSPRRRSKSRSRSRSGYRKRYRNSRYRRSSRRSTSRSDRRGGRSRSKSYSRNSRRRYSSRSSSGSRGSRYRRSSRRNYRGLGFRRPSGSPRPRK